MNTIKALVISLFLSVSLMAKATIIEINGQGALDGSWEITELASTYGDAQSILMDQLWWGDSGLANIFAQALGPIAITTDSYNKRQNFGAFFARQVQVNSTNTSFTDLYFRAWRTSTNTLGNYRGIDFGNPNDTTIIVFATATRVPEPTTIALLGLSLFGLVFSRRKKI
jgi:hypothetical protein